MGGTAETRLGISLWANHATNLDRFGQCFHGFIERRIHAQVCFQFLLAWLVACVDYLDLFGLGCQFFSHVATFRSSCTDSV